MLSEALKLIAQYRDAVYTLETQIKTLKKGRNSTHEHQWHFAHTNQKHEKSEEETFGKWVDYHKFVCHCGASKIVKEKGE